ncbi:unnamed protein product [Trypanosoma congolense IL3000]|uniref:WGS project CAEQ00000000 data, annotated contig 837 n=1 Tax=Trypanosoma congolense (strain IL3000) TaxID=1068625 RepID=F9WIU8_TRYCI|nr:unnamed protein product [Trypanosoma congolense IL3000]
MQVTSAVRQGENAEKATAVFIEYERAFDSVDHRCVIEALKAFGVEVHLVARIARFLQGRTAQVRVSSIKSEDIEMMCGVPQGSVLGPLLLLITAVDSPSNRLNEIQGFMHGFFGDDLTIICIHAEICRRFRKRRRRAWIGSPVGQRSSLWRPQRRGRSTRCLDPATKIC